MNTVNLFVVKTLPGEEGAFAPPKDFSGGDDAYRDLLRQRWQTHPGFRQQIALVGRNLHLRRQVTFEGPFADIAKDVARKAWSNAKGKNEKN